MSYIYFPRLFSLFKKKKKNICGIFSLVTPIFMCFFSLFFRFFPCPNPRFMLESVREKYRLLNSFWIHSCLRFQFRKKRNLEYKYKGRDRKKRCDEKGGFRPMLIAVCVRWIPVFISAFCLKHEGGNKKEIYINVFV